MNIKKLSLTVFLFVVFIATSDSSALAAEQACSGASKAISPMTYYIAFIYIVACVMMRDIIKSVSKFYKNMKTALINCLHVTADKNI